MISAKRNWIKCGLSLLLAAAIFLSMGIWSLLASAAITTQSNDGSTSNDSLPDGASAVTQLKVPVEDGLYYAKINLKHSESTGRNSMGNAALRGSDDFLSKHPEDTDYRQMIVIEGGKATAIVEFMPMGCLGMYGFMMELESVTTTAWKLSPIDDYSTYTPATVIAEHRTVDGEVVYDPFNDPNSESAFDGSDPSTMTRPAGQYGRDEAILVDIVNHPYSHVLALDVTPITIDGVGDLPDDYTEWGINQAAYVHVFVPVMGAISITSGDQYARMQVDWTSLEKVEKPEENIQYQMYLASQIEKGNYTDSSYAALQSAIEDAKETLSNIWPSQTLDTSGEGFNKIPILNQKEFTDEEEKGLSKKITDAVESLEEKGDKSSLDSLISEADDKAEGDYTPNSWEKFSDKLAAAKDVQKDENASVSDVTTAVNDLTAAMNELEKRADISALNALIDEAKSMENDGYTADSWNALQTAIANAEATAADLNASQANVNTRLDELQDAVDGLVKDGKLDRFNLEDGIYSVYGEMIKMNREEKSMSNDAINHTIKLTVEDGKYYITMDFKGLHYLNRFGYLAELSYYENGYIFGQYGTVSGTRILAEVLSTQKNADGSDVIDEFNQAGGSSEGIKYPDLIKFPLVDDALNDTDGYVPLHVYVPVMEDISAGTGAQDVLLKLDWSTLAAADEDDFVSDDNIKLSPAVDITDMATGVKVSADEGVFDEGVRLVVNEITSGSDYSKAASALSDVGKKFELYEIHFVDASGKEVQPNGTVEVSYPIPDGYDAGKVALYRINDDGSKTLISGKAENGYYVVVAKSFSQYALVEKGSAVADAENPKTGDNYMLGVMIIAMAAAAGTAGAATLAGKLKIKQGE